VIAIEQFHRPRLAGLDDLARLVVPGVLGIAERPLPEPHVADRNIKVPVLQLELLQWRMLPVAMPGWRWYSTR
jgi:hypothetical protein